MTKFDKTKFNYHGGYLTYDGKFVARFKYRAMKMGSFKSFLIKNFSVEEYFEMYNDGKGLPPLKILETKGYDWMSPEQKARLEELKKAYT